ncbi:MAG: hypothetical protein AB9880_07040 [Christensenellales bacterium]
MDIQAMVQKVVDAVKKDKALLTKFLADPIKTVESVLGVNLPDEQIKAVVKGVKDKVGGLGGEAEKAAGGILEKIKRFFSGK